MLHQQAAFGGLLVQKWWRLLLQVRKKYLGSTHFH